MKFNLKLLFFLTTLLAVGTVVAISVIRHQIALKSHREQFQKLAAVSASYDTQIKSALAKQPTVSEVLEAFESPVPENFLAGGCGHGYSSSPGASPNFETKYSYSWQHPFDPVNNGQVDVTVEGSFDKTDLEKHAISITHTDTAIGKAVADLVAAELQKDKDRKLQISTKTF